MKILNVNASIDSVSGGGTAERTVQMSKALSEAGHQCSLLTLNLGVTPERRNQLANVELIVLPCISTRLYLPFPSLGKVSQAVKNADVIHLMNHWTVINAIAYLFIKIHRKKYVVCPAGALPIFGRSKLIKKIYNWFIGNRIIRDADAQIVIAKDEIAQFAQYGVDDKKIVWIPNGIDPEALKLKSENDFRKKFNIGNSPFIFYLGRLNPIKGIDLLVQAFCTIQSEYPEYHLVIAGPDEGLLASLQSTVEKTRVAERVHFVGPILGNVKAQVLHEATLMVVPSRQEAMSIVVLEAGVVGTPVILTDQCGLNFLDELDAAIIVSATADGIKAGLRGALENTVGLKKKGENLKKHVLENYHWQAIVKKFEETYLKILRSPNIHR